MPATLIADENWNVLMSAFPQGWKEAARSANAIKHELKDFKSEGDLLRVLLLHIGRGLSLRETSTVARFAGIADVSDVAILKRLRKSEGWLLRLCQQLAMENGLIEATSVSHTEIRVVDASVIKEPGKTGSQWRLHFGIKLPSLTCDAFEITSTDGKGTGESFSRFDVSVGDYIMGDRGYSTAAGIAHVASRNAHVLVRLVPHAVLFQNEDGKRFDLLSHLREVRNPHEVGQWRVELKFEELSHEGRVCCVRKSDVAIADSVERIRRTASRKGKKIKPETLETAKYVIIFSNYPEEKYSASELLELYRLRWQIELVFKRMKSLLSMGHLPKFDPQSARAWLYGKLFLALLAEKLSRLARAFSPWGYPLQESLA